jgi:hypothetical protein
MQIRLQFPALPLDENERAMRVAQRELIFGWAIVCMVDDVEHYDCENTHIPEGEMFEAAVDFYLKRRVGKHNHEGKLAGTVDYSLPLTREIANTFGMPCSMTGWMIAWRPLHADVIDQFRRGELQGFSIGGWADHEPSPRGHILRHLRVDEISVVDDPGQPLATARLIKDIDNIVRALVGSA